MSLAQDGIHSKIKTHTTIIKVDETHPLIMLANILPWSELSELVCIDLKTTTAKGFWMVGRKLFLRSHLGILILQARTKKTDREIVNEIQDNAIYQAFCGSTLIKNWKCPHPTKVEEFRSRLSPEIKMKINEVVVRVAVKQGMADPSLLDVDSTVQEANMSYPTDAGMLLKLAKKCEKVSSKLNIGFTMNLKKIGGLAKEYFFRGKISLEAQGKILSKLVKTVKKEVLPVITGALRVFADSSAIRFVMREYGIKSTVVDRTP